MPASVTVPNAPARTLLLVNLGTPDAPTAPAVRRYLAEFLGDRRVVSIPPLLWQPLLRGLILPLRGPRSAAKYASVWLPEGSPLAVYTRRLAAAVQARLPDWRVDWAMRYGRPALAELLARAQGELVVLPLYPQYSTTTTASVRDVVEAVGVPARFIDSYFEDTGWAAAVAGSIARWREANGAGAHLLFSFHGLPQRVADAGDPYPRQCQRSAALIAAALGLGEGEWSLAYQSRFGRERWLEPATDARLRELHAAGVRRVDVACPGFAADCLETLEEVGLLYASQFAALGGQLRLIPCLNDAPAHADALAQLARRALEPER
ncbi:MAG: ferrochelatase [Pseudoxanthomonas sp.]